MEDYFSVLRKFAQFDGRAGRREFWMFTLWNGFIYFVIVGTFADSYMWIGAYNGGTMPNPAVIKVSLAFYALIVLVPSLSLRSRRLHDLNRSAWWLLILLVPIVGAIGIDVFAAFKGDAGPNQYGPAPTTNAPNELHQTNGIMS